MEICPVISTEQVYTQKYGAPRERYKQALKQDGPSSIEAEKSHPHIQYLLNKKEIISS